MRVGVDTPPPGRVLVVGAGGLGGITTALLWQRWVGHDWPDHDDAGHPSGPPAVVALTTNQGIARASHAEGLRVGGVDPEQTVRAVVVDRLPTAWRAAQFDWIVLAVQPPQVEEAARDVAQHLAPGGKMVCFQNGLCEERVERIVGEGRVVGAVVAWGGSMPEPARYLRTARGGFTIGMPSGAEDPALQDLARWLEPVGPVRITTNLRGARWSKLAINSAISTLGTLGGGTLGAVMMHRSARRLGLEVMSETVEVARALGVKLEKIGGLDLEWIALTEKERVASGSPTLVAKHSLLLALGARYRRMRSSMLAAIERGRIPAVDFLNGEVADRGEALGVPTPVNREAQRMVHEMARGRVQAGIGALQLLRERVDARGQQ